MNGLPTLLLGASLVLLACDRSDSPPPDPPSPTSHLPHGTGLDDRRVAPLALDPKTATVLIFVRSDCPVANRFMPEIKRLADEFGPQGVHFFLIYPNDSIEIVRTHRRDYQIKLPTLADPHHALTNAYRATKTPEAVVFNQQKAQVYRGRIDDRFADLGELRPAPTQSDLRDVLTALAGGEHPNSRTTEVVGCFIE